MEHLHPTSAQNKIIRTPKTPSDQTQQQPMFATSASNVEIRVGVVPEHFSTPFHIGSEQQIFNKHGLVNKVDVIEHPRGTGSMCKSLRENKLDVAIALTEGLLSDIIKNQLIVDKVSSSSTSTDSFRICGTYVHSSLVWGIVTKNSNRIGSLSDLKNNGKIGISRFGSGSHIMSYLLAEKEHWYNENNKNETKESKKQKDLSVQFVPCGGLDDLRQGIAKEEIDTFLWETFMLKHFVDQGELKMLGSIETPWPCFMIAVRDQFANDHPKELSCLLDALQECCTLFYQDRQDSLEFISRACHLSMEDAAKWFNTVRFATDMRKVSEEMLRDTIATLQRTGVLEDTFSAADINIEHIYNNISTPSE